MKVASSTWLDSGFLLTVLSEAMCYVLACVRESMLYVCVSLYLFFSVNSETVVPKPVSISARPHSNQFPFLSRYFPPVVRSAFFTDLPETSFAGWPVIGTASTTNAEMQMCLPTTTLPLWRGRVKNFKKGHEVATVSPPFPRLARIHFSLEDRPFGLHRNFLRVYYAEP